MTMDLSGMTGEQQAQALVAQGWTWAQVKASYPHLFGAGTEGATIPTQTVITAGPGDLFGGGGEGGPSLMTRAEQIARGWLDPMGEAGTGPVVGEQAGSALPGGVAGILAALGFSAAAIATLGVGYGASQMLGVQYPWETGPGEGFIAPWTRDIVQDESGRWVTRETRPDLFANGGNGGALVPFAGAAGVMGVGIAKKWTANGWPFVMTTDGFIHTVKKSGVRVRYKPYKSVVLGKNPSPRQLSRAITKFVAFDKLHSRIQKMARRIKT